MKRRAETNNEELKMAHLNWNRTYFGLIFDVYYYYLPTFMYLFSYHITVYSLYESKSNIVIESRYYFYFLSLLFILLLPT
jgi:hypothetical protein